MAEEGSGCPVPRLAWASPLRGIILLGALVLFVIAAIYCIQNSRESQEWDIAELQLNYTGLRQDPRLHWQGGPALGRSFLHGPTLNNGQLCVQRDGIYRLHIQVTLANCSSTQMTTPREATLAVGICAPATRQVSLLRLYFYHSCTVGSHRLTPLARGDVLCTNLTVTLRASPNADETFFGVQWMHS
ncbi:PREDICTED: CD70 antigen-like [Chrysochloris asiatica]|uniref:CD70 antigen n=1 Tax=Chrysochloris asiatica TaxID=185453 RepID=A0A9B0X3P8_CHRAS|nr:PREDICTED: CD70 antigen-like [Chrysochloris asiatica]